MKTKYLLCATEKIPEKKVPDAFFLFPLKDFSVGFLKTYSLNEITMDDAFLYINRMLNTVDIKNLKKELSKLPKNIKGIVFEDLGVYEVIKDQPLEKVFYASHAVCSTYTLNTYLKKMDTVIISPDITVEETKEMIANATKEVSIFGLGHLPYMYSRRTLNQNYATHFKYQKEAVLALEETISHKKFLAVENPYGTVLYDESVYNAHCLQNEPLKYVVINPFLTQMTYAEAIAEFKNPNQPYTTGFLNQKTIYRVKEEE